MIAAAVRKFDDLINPIVVKELRQAVAGKFIAAVLVMLLIVSLLVLGGFLLVTDLADEDNFEIGRIALYFFQGVLVTTCMLFLPLYAGIRMAIERSDHNTDLMFITAIPPRAVVWGKLLATALLGLVIYAACMPFMTLTYLMRGVDLPSIFLVLAMGFAVVLLAMHLAILVACLTTSLAARILLGLMLLGTLVTTTSWTIGGSVAIVESGAASAMGSWDFWGPALTIAVNLALALGLMFFWSVALIKPPSANRALPVRMYMTFVWLISLLEAVVWLYVDGDADILSAWAIFAVLFAALGMFIATGERDAWGPRVARAVPRNRLLRLPAFVFYSGSAGGLLWACGLAAMTLVLMGLGARFAKPLGLTGTVEEEALFGAVGIACYAFSYCMTCVLLQRYVVGGFIRRSHTWALAVLLLALGTLVPLLIGQLILGFTPWKTTEATVFWLLNPFGLANDDYRFACLVFSIVWAVVMVLVSLPWLIRRASRFGPNPWPTPVQAERRSS